MGDYYDEFADVVMCAVGSAIVGILLAWGAVFSVLTNDIVVAVPAAGLTICAVVAMISFINEARDILNDIKELKRLLERD